ncbi:MAG: GAF domain-containing protein [Desulforegulaceae bacterium]|nr:GAF domain-containing protein [Desulforegulaceae bacterium]
MSGKPDARIQLLEFKAISYAISTYEDLSLLHRHLVEGVCSAFRIKACSIKLYDDREKELIRVASSGFSRNYLKNEPMIVQGENQDCLNGAVIYYEDLRTDKRLINPEAAEKEGIVSMLAVPIQYGSAVLGILYMCHDKPWILHDDDLDAFTVFTRHLGLRIEYTGLRNFFETVKAAAGNLPLRMIGEVV